MNSVGYIVSHKIRGGIVPQRVQNIIIKEYAASHKIKYALSATESNLGGCTSTLSSLVSSYREILIYSLYIVIENRLSFNLVEEFIENGGTVHFCAEAISYSKTNLLELKNLFYLNREQKRNKEIENSLYVIKDN